MYGGKNHITFTNDFKGKKRTSLQVVQGGSPIHSVVLSCNIVNDHNEYIPSLSNLNIFIFRKL